MKSKITEQKKNDFLGRTEFMLEIEKESAPTKQEIIAELGKDEKLTVVNKVYSYFGKKTFLANVFVYDNEEMKNKYMIIPKKIRDQMEKDRKEAEKKAKEEAEEASEETK